MTSSLAQPTLDHPVAIGDVRRPRATLGTVVVTGASTGIGRATAEHLASLGYHVVAGVRNRSDFRALAAASHNIRPIMLDICNADDVANLARDVAEIVPTGITALVNNAGIGAVGPTETLEIDAWRSVLEVNVVGTVAVTQALLPSLLLGRGRIINVGSAAGRLAFPLFGPYVASKFALEGLTDVLRREVEQHGVRVICVQPGVVNSSIYDKNLAESHERSSRLSGPQRQRYGKLLESAHSAAEDTRTSGTPSSAVAPVIARAIRSRRPKTRYATGWDGRAAVVGARLIPDRWADRAIAFLTR